MTPIARRSFIAALSVASVGGATTARALDALPDARFVGFAQAVNDFGIGSGNLALARSANVLREGGRLVAVAEEPPPEIAERVHSTYFVVEPDRQQLGELASLANDGILRPAIDSVFSMKDAHAAFDRVMSSGKRGKVVIEVDHA